MARDNSIIANEIIEAFNRHDLVALEALLWPDAQQLDVAFSEEVAYLVQARTWLTAFPDARLDLIASYPADERVVVEFYRRGTHQGPLRAGGLDFLPTGRRLTLRCLEILQFRQGKLAGSRLYFDRAGLWEAVSQSALHAPAQAPSPDAWHG